MGNWTQHNLLPDSTFAESFTKFPQDEVDKDISKQKNKQSA